MSFASTLARLRKATGLTQAEFAQRAGVDLDSYRRWEQGRHVPKVNDAYRLAKALGVPLGELILPADMEEADAPPAPPTTTRKPKGK